MTISEMAKAELKLYAQTELFRDREENPFQQNAHIDVDAYIAFNDQFNEFTNHASRPFRPMAEKDLKLSGNNK